MLNSERILAVLFFSYSSGLVLKKTRQSNFLSLLEMVLFWRKSRKDWKIEYIRSRSKESSQKPKPCQKEIKLIFSINMLCTKTLYHLLITWFSISKSIPVLGNLLYIVTQIQNHHLVFLYQTLKHKPTINISNYSSPSPHS